MIRISRSFGQFLVLVIFMQLLIAVHGCAQQKKTANMAIVHGVITQTSDYCGGAQPTEELLDRLKTPQPAVGKTIYVVYGTGRQMKRVVYKKLVTDSLGQFSIKLKGGMTFAFVEEWKIKPIEYPKDTEYMKWDRECYRQRYMSADYTLRVKPNSNPEVKINYHQPCFYKPYCGQYSGPLPP